MLIIPIKEGENIERALKKYKKKYEKTNMMKQLRARKEFQKPSIARRQEIIRAAYKQVFYLHFCWCTHFQLIQQSKILKKQD